MVEHTEYAMDILKPGVEASEPELVAHTQKFHYYLIICFLHQKNGNNTFLTGLRD